MIKAPIATAATAAVELWCAQPERWKLEVTPMTTEMQKTGIDTLTQMDNFGDYVEGIGRTLMMHLVRIEPRQPRVNALPKWRLKRVKEYVDAHLDESIGLSDLAATIGVSRNHFAAQFRMATGYRPHHYIRYRRVESAKTILSSTDMPLAEVALATGFRAQSYFSTIFKRLTGETPASWRRHRRN
jgi:AraC family transcriptional regulator